MRSPLQWLVPIADDMSRSDVPILTAIIRIDERACVTLGTDRPGGPLLVATPLEVVGLAQALLDASREAGAVRAKGRKR